MRRFRCCRLLRYSGCARNDIVQPVGSIAEPQIEAVGAPAPKRVSEPQPAIEQGALF
jgi:hypothetical protein